MLRTKELSLEVRERVQAHLFMHIVSTEFSLFVAAPGAAGQLELRHAGCLRRRGILCKVRSGSGLEPLREALQGATGPCWSSSCRWTSGACASAATTGAGP